MKLHTPLVTLSLLLFTGCGELVEQDPRKFNSKFQNGQGDAAESYAIMETAAIDDVNGLEESTDIDSEISDRKAKILEKFDTNGDGVLSQDEIDALVASFKERFLSRFDSNGDGEIDASEIEAAKLKMHQKRRGMKGHGKRMKRRGPPPFGPHSRGPGDGFSPEKRQELCEKVAKHQETWTDELLTDFPKLQEIIEMCESQPDSDSE